MWWWSAKGRGAVKAPTGVALGKKRGRGRASLARAAVLALFLAALALRLYLATTPGYEDDTTHFKWWTKLVTQEGLSQAYSGTYPETYAIYPPLMLLFLKALGHLYQGLFSPSFALDDPRLGLMIKGLGIAFELFTWLVLFIWARRWRGFRAASLATLAYAFNPALIFDVAYWGEPDSIHSFFVLLSLVLLIERRPWLSWAFLAAAAFVKPQAWVFLPLAAALTLGRCGPRALVGGVAVGLGASFMLVSPFLYHGTFKELLSLPQQVYEAMPFLSANAHNLWWLYSPGPPFVPDDGRVGFLSYRTVGLLTLGAFYGYSLWRLRGHTEWAPILGTAAFVGFIFFMLPTRVHENHMFMVFPLLALPLTIDERLRWVYGVLSLTFLANLALHDPPLTAALRDLAALPLWQALQIGNSVVNALVLLVWASILPGKASLTRSPSKI